MGLFSKKKSSIPEPPPSPEAPQGPTIEQAKEALAHAEEVYALTPGLKHQAKIKADVFVDAIMKAIADRGSAT
jgi:hypothetical protein